MYMMMLNMTVCVHSLSCAFLHTFSHSLIAYSFSHILNGNFALKILAEVRVDYGAVLEVLQSQHGLLGQPLSRNHTPPHQTRSHTSFKTPHFDVLCSHDRKVGSTLVHTHTYTHTHVLTHTNKHTHAHTHIRNKHTA